MAFLPIQDQNNQAPQGQTTANPAQGTGNPPPQSGGSVGVGSGTAKTGGTPGSGTSTQFGSSASKLGDYLSANAPQITQQASGVANNLNTQYGQVSGDIGNAVNQFGQQVSAGYAAPNQTLVDQTLANPTILAANPTNLAGFQAQYNDTYTGPQNFESTTPYGTIQNEVSNAVQSAAPLNTQAGLQGYFAKNGGPNQTQASNTLDALLIQGNPNAQQTVNTAAGQFANLTPQLTTATAGADAGVTTAQQAAQQAAQYAQGQFGNTVNNFNQGINTELTNANNTNQQNIANYNADVKGLTAGNFLTPQQMQSLGVTQSQYNSLLAPVTEAATPNWYVDRNSGAQSTPTNINLNQWLQQLSAAPAATANQVATPEQFAEQQALSQLGGGQPLPGALLDPTLAAQAGTYKPTSANPTFDYNAALSGATAQDQAIQQAAKNQAYQTQNTAHIQHNQNSGGFFSNLLSNPLAQYLANPLLAVPQEIKQGAKKI